MTLRQRRFVMGRWAGVHVPDVNCLALRIQLAAPDGRELAQARQQGGAAVLLGFKNGGKGLHRVGPELVKSANHRRRQPASLP
jgi:hypothetical protein